MKSILSILFGLFAYLSLVAQSIPPLYQNIEKAYNDGDYAACLKYEKALSDLALQRTDTLIANAYFYLADASVQTGKIEKAIVLFEKEKSTREKLKLENTEDYSNTLSNLIYLYYEVGQYEKSGSALDLLIDNDKKNYGVTSTLYVQTILNAAETLLKIDRLKDADQLLSNTLKQQSKTSGNYALLLYKLGDIAQYSGQYRKANAALTEALPLVEKSFGKNSPEYFAVLINYGNLQMRQGKYPEAEETFDAVLELLSPKEELYVAALNDQALVYRSLAQYEKSERIFKELKSLDSATLGQEHPDYAITLSNIGLVQTDMGKYKEAEASLTASLNIQRKSSGTKTIAYARKQTNLARTYQLSDNAAKAIPLLEQAAATFKTVLGEKSPEYATALFNLGMANWKAGKGSVGIKQLKSSADIRAAVLGKKHPRYAESAQKLAEYHWSQKQKKEALLRFGEVFENYYNQIDLTFPALTEEEKAKFYYTNLRPSFDKFNAFAVAARTEIPTITADLYNHQINTKGVIMLATEKVKQGIQAANDPALSELFESWQTTKEQIAKLYGQQGQNASLDSLITEANLLEKELTRRSALFASQFIKKRSSWEAVQQQLKPNEAAVEVIRFTDYNPDMGGQFLETIRYAFLIVTKESKGQPDLIMLNNGRELESKFMNFYRNSVRFQQADNYSYKNYFEPLGDYLKKNNIQKVFLSPEGVYNQINLNSIINPFTQKYIIDEYDIHLLNNTRELTDNVVDRRVGQTPVLLGFPKFNLETNSTQQVAVTRGATRGTTRGGITRGLRGGLLRYMRGDGDGISVLPGTQKEIKEIAGLFADQPLIFMESQAAENTLKSVNNPRILHIATHGYFLEDEALGVDEKQSQFVANPLLKAGLILAGAENFLLTGTPLAEGGDDGILTAYEAMNLNLDNTDLVVLSACETGLGQIKNGEGVYGLQRAFRLAGTKNIVMSLWSVDDEATQELMSLFYKEMINGKSQHEAFRSAQQQLKEKFKQPFYWGAFIMVGK
ncbi:MAG: CHAT domain-containing protein [Cytophagia bacterium]|nr:CHAT domain-containing protein [Cytophagia bacterium]